MAGRLALPLLLLAPLALPQGASAAVRTVSVPLSKDGDVSFAQYRVKVGAPRAPTATIANARRLGEAKVIAVVDRLKRRTYLVTVFTMNPTGGASAAQAKAARIKIRHRDVRELTVRQEIEAVQNVLRQDAQLGGENAIYQLCTSKAARKSIRRKLKAQGLSSGTASKVLTALIAYLCQSGTPAEIMEAQQTLQGLGVRVPDCSGTVDGFEGRLSEVVVVLLCRSRVDAIAILAQDGNTGTNCLGPPGSSCQAGPGCAPLPPNAVCYFDSDGLAVGTGQTLNARFAQDVPEGQAGPFVQGRTLGSSGQVEPAYLFPHITN